ncbi:MAG: flagellar brake protein [Desulfobacteraceae bacterium]|nr:flagellar brake protein [Desulfobacteraceae bacterium]
MDNTDQHHIDLSQRLFIELGTSLLIETSGKLKSFSGKLVGMKVGNYLIVDISEVEPAATKLFKEDQVLVKYINLEDIFNFSSVIISVLQQPDHLVFLKYPEMVESCNIRSEKRVDCFIPVGVKIGNKQIQGTVTNISPKGCLCSIDYFKLWKNINDQKITLFFPYGDLETLAISGDTRSTQKQAYQIRLGIKFNEVNQFAQSVLTTLVPALRI